MIKQLTRPIALITAAGALLTAGATLHPYEIDLRIESSAAKSYVFKTCLKGDSITIESRNGAVTLTGYVADASQRALAQDTVEGLPGVKSVDNQLKFKVEGPAEHSDGWIGLKVKSALLFHRNVRASKTDVNVRDGFVTLSGEALSSTQIELTAEYAKDVEGVKGVKNEMTVARVPVKSIEATAEKIDDASITAEVKASLMAHRSTSALKTKVETTDGVVTVSGAARNSAEKSLVTRLVAGIDGVIGVNNNMTVAVEAASNN